MATISAWFRTYLAVNPPHCDNTKCPTCKVYDMQAGIAYMKDPAAPGNTDDNAMMRASTYMVVYRKSQGSGRRSNVKGTDTIANLEARLAALKARA